MKKIIKNIKDVLKERKKDRRGREISDEDELIDEKTPLLNLLKKIITSNDKDAGEHIKKVRKFAKIIASSICLNDEKVLEIEKMSVLHDIGKLGISKDILCKKGVLTEAEYLAIKKHTSIGYEMLKEVNLGKIAENIVLYHHEKWDGTGYPKGKKGKQIPIEARIVAIADVYGTLRQSRCYKNSKTHEEAMNLIINESGLTFDPDLVEIFKIYHEEFKEIYNNCHNSF